MPAARDAAGVSLLAFVSPNRPGRTAASPSSRDSCRDVARTIRGTPTFIAERGGDDSSFDLDTLTVSRVQ